MKNARPGQLVHLFAILCFLWGLLAWLVNTHSGEIVIPSTLGKGVLYGVFFASLGMIINRLDDLKK